MILAMVSLQHNTQWKQIQFSIFVFSLMPEDMRMIFELKIAVLIKKNMGDKIFLLESMKYSIYRALGLD